MATSVTPPLHHEAAPDHQSAEYLRREEAAIACQTASPVPAVLCPVCRRTNDVRTIQAAFDVGIVRIAPPAMPASNARMAPWIVGGFCIFLAGNFYLFVELGANSTKPWPVIVQFISALVNVLAVLVGLVLSFIAVLRVSRAELEETAQYPAWDRAMDTWNRLYYCLWDNVVIDPERKRVLSEAELRALISTESQGAREQTPFLTHGDIHSLV